MYETSKSSEIMQQHCETYTVHMLSYSLRYAMNHGKDFFVSRVEWVCKNCFCPGDHRFSKILLMINFQICTNFTKIFKMWEVDFPFSFIFHKDATFHKITSAPAPFCDTVFLYWSSARFTEIIMFLLWHAFAISRRQWFISEASVYFDSQRKKRERKKTRPLIRAFP